METSKKKDRKVSFKTTGGVFFVLILLSVLIGWYIVELWQPRFPAELYKIRKGPINCGHRGAAGLAPENTMRAFQAAVNAKADAVEFDVMLTKDHKLVL